MPLCGLCAAVRVWKNENRILENGVFVSVGGNLAPAKKKSDVNLAKSAEIQCRDGTGRADN